MITNKKDYLSYLEQDKKALGIEKNILLWLEMKFGNFKGDYVKQNFLKILQMATL